MSHRVCVLGFVLALATATAEAQAILSPTRYELDVTVDYASETLDGTARIELTNPSAEAVREASFMLYRLLRAESVRDAGGRDLAFKQAVVSFQDFAPLQVNQITATLPEPLAPGARTTVEIHYGGYLLGYSETGMRYVQDRIDTTFTILRDDAFTYPKVGYPSVAGMRGAPEPSFSYAARITVPRGLTVANGGRLEGVDTVGTQLTFHYASLKPSWRMDFAIAKYAELSSRAFRVCYLPGDREGAAGVARAAEQSFDLFSRWFGPQRGETSLTMIEIPDGWGSQTDVTCIIQAAAAFRDPARHREVYHEISHLWNVTPTDRPSPRWNEGLASFLEYLATEELSGEPVLDARAAQLLARLRGDLAGHPRWRKVPMVDYGRTGLAGLSYSTGAMFFDLLYRLVGRETFNKIIGRYYADYFASGGDTKQLVEIMRKSTKVNVALLADDWIFTTAWTERVEQNATMDELVSYYARAGRKSGR